MENLEQKEYTTISGVNKIFNVWTWVNGLTGSNGVDVITSKRQALKRIKDSENSKELPNEDKLNAIVEEEKLLSE